MRTIGSGVGVAVGMGDGVDVGVILGVAVFPIGRTDGNEPEGTEQPKSAVTSQSPGRRRVIFILFLYW
jgi:hypothetical protein